MTKGGGMLYLCHRANVLFILITETIFTALIIQKLTLMTGLMRIQSINKIFQKHTGVDLHINIPWLCIHQLEITFCQNKVMRNKYQIVRM